MPTPSSSASAPRSLESLSLARGCMTAAHLSQLIERYRGTLRALSLQQLLIAQLGDWPVVLGRLGSQAPLLESLSVHWLSTYGDEPFSHVMFPGLVSDHVVPESEGRSLTRTTRKVKGENRVFGVSYRGPAVGKALEMLAREARPI